MATVNLGRIKFVWQGAYSGATAYVADDVVSYNGSSYICILASTGNLPTNTTYWSLMAQSGTDITSLAGLAQGDVLYYNGTSWVRLGAGTSGQFLKTNGASANPSWATVTSKLLGQSMTVYQTPVNLGNVYRNATVVSGLTTTHVPVSTNSYFVVSANIYSTASSNHHRGTLEYSTNGGSTWSAAWTNTRSGEHLSWSNDDLYAYSHLVFEYLSGFDVNTQSIASTKIKYAPTTPHSITDFRVRVSFFNNDDTTNVYVNRNIDGGAGSNHGQIPASTIEIIEYQA